MPHPCAVKLRTVVAAVLLVVLTAGCGGANKAKETASSSAPTTSADGSGAVTPEQARAIAKEAYIYGFPMVDSYRIQYSYFVDSHNPEYKGAWNEVHSIARVYTPGRHRDPDAELRHPVLDAGRGPARRAAGADRPADRAGPLLLAAVHRRLHLQLRLRRQPHHRQRAAAPTCWPVRGGRARSPTGINEVIRSDTDFVLVVYRTQLFGPDDLDNVKKIQAGYKAEPLSAFLKQPAPAAAPTVDFPTPLTPDEQKTSPKFFDLLNFALQFAPALPRRRNCASGSPRSASAGDGTFNAEKLSPEMRKAIEAGHGRRLGRVRHLQEGQDRHRGGHRRRSVRHQSELNGNYLYRMAGAVLGIYGNSKAEAMYPALSTDADGQPLTGANNYTLTFAPGQLPPVNAFWSVTMYKLPESLLVENPINRYLINSPMLPEPGARTRTAA